MPNILPQGDIDLELCALLGIDLAMKKEVIKGQEEEMEEQEEEVMKEQEDGIEGQDKTMEEREEGMEEQEEMEKHNGGIQEQENLIEEQEKRMEEGKTEEFLGIATHRIKHALEENNLVDSFNDAAELKSEHSQKSPQVGAKKEHSENTSSKRTQLTKANMTKNTFFQRTFCKEQNK